MKSKVLITVTGLLYTGSGEDEKDYVDVITPGRYDLRRGEHILHYKEQIEGFEEPVFNRISISPEKVVLHKSGLLASEMIFIPKTDSETWYSTPYGRMDLSVYTHRITVTESPERIEADIRYRLFINGVQENRCFVKILVQPQGEESGFSLNPQEGNS